MTLVYIHGASATSDSFNYIKSKIGSGVDIDYDSGNGFANNLAAMKLSLINTQDMFFIAHSLGGIYSLHLANHMPKQVLGAVTLSTPYGGAEVADYAKYFIPFSRLMRDIGPASDPMRQADLIEIHHPWTNIVTVKGGAAWIIGPNDGVVTVASQRHHNQGMELIEVDCNHYEVVLNDQVIAIIQDKIATINNS
jgi:pimeloyl-ACP methyl ester carboxylesterase